MTDREIKLSVIIASYNYEDYVGRAIESVISQHSDACELIVVDDGSLDGSWEKIQSYGLAHAFRVVNGGAARACLAALRRSRAPFVLFLDSDDELAPGSLAEILARLDPAVAKLQFALTPIDSHGRVLGPPSPPLSDYRARESLRREVSRSGVYTSPPTSGNVFRRDLCELLAKVDYETSVDGVTVFAAPFFGDVVSIAKPLGFYRLHARNFSQSGSRPQASRFRTEAERFEARHMHLRRVLKQIGSGVRLRDPQGLFFYRERQIYAAILDGGRPRFLETAALVGMALTGTGSPPRRVALALFLILCWCLPSRHRSALLEFRFGPRRRSRLNRLCRSVMAHT